MRRWLLLLLATVLLTGCIRRYKAPEEPVIPTTPYSALALYRQITPPLLPGGAPLPKAAVRVAVSGDSVFGDAALIDGPEHPGITETWAGVIALLQIRQGDPTVLVADLVGAERACQELGDLSAGLLWSVRADETPLHPMKERDAADGLSADRLRGVTLDCSTLDASGDDDDSAMD